MSKKIIQDSNIDEIESSSNLSILKFSAEWCGPCQMFLPVYKEASLKYENVIFGEVDIDDDDSKKTVAKYSVTSVPTTVFLKDGKEIDRFSGYKPLDKFEEIIEKNK